MKIPKKIIEYKLLDKSNGELIMEMIYLAFKLGFKILALILAIKLIKFIITKGSV